MEVAIAAQQCATERLSTVFCSKTTNWKQSLPQCDPFSQIHSNICLHSNSATDWLDWNKAQTKTSEHCTLWQCHALTLLRQI